MYPLPKTAQIQRKPQYLYSYPQIQSDSSS